MGVPFGLKPYVPLTWEDRFQQLVEFGLVNRHFNVPNPATYNVNGRLLLQDRSPEVAEATRFFRFVQRIHHEHRNLQQGIPSNMLTENRLRRLEEIGFKFSNKAGPGGRPRAHGRPRHASSAEAEKEVPDVSWSTRIQQLEAFRSEMGHLHVDPSYDKFANLGGWARCMREMHRRWQKNGKELSDPSMVEKLGQLTEMGFAFDLFPDNCKRRERSWEHSFNLLLKYRKETGSTRVPHHYEADYRLGSWVAEQREDYMSLIEGKPSKITDKKVRRLEAIGFEWDTRQGDVPKDIKDEQASIV